MFTIADDSMKGNNGSFGAAIVKMSGTPHNAVTFTMADAIPDLADTESIAIVGNQVTTTIADPITVQVGNQIFVPAVDPNAPIAGEFVNIGGTITLTGNTSSNTGAIIRGYGDYPPSFTPTTRILNPDAILRRYDASGTFTADRSLEGHPSASLNFVVQARSVQSILNQFRNNVEVTIYGVGYRVASVKMERLSEKLYPGRSIGVSIDFKGKWESWGNPSQSPLDTPIKLRALVCKLKRDLTLSDLCSIVGVRYSGPRLIIKVRGNIDRSASTTVRQELEQTAENHGGFIYWSNPNAIEVRSWNIISSRSLPMADVLSDSISYSANGETDVIVDGVQLTKIYDQCRWQPETSNSDDSANPLAVTYTITYENAVANDFSGYDLRWPPGTNEYGQAANPFDNDILRNPSNNWDSGGPTKTETKTVTVQGEPFSEEVTTYGFVFTTDNTYKLNGANEIVFDDNAGTNNPATYWVEVERKITQYKYDKDNYLIGTTTMGYRKARPKQETESLEMIRLDQELADGANPDDVTFLKALFTPKDLPINAYSTYALENFSNYYDDIKPETKDEGCKDSQWVEPKFARIYESIDTSLEFGNNPNSTTEEILPAIAYGKNQRERKYIQIIIPESRKAKIRKPERFKETTYTQNQEGEGLSQGLNIGSANINDGRPSVQPRVEPADKITAIARNKGKEDLASFNFWFSCGTTIDTSAPEKESISFTYVDDENQAREVAALRLAKENTQNAFTCSINVRYRNYYQEGDIIHWDGRTWRILGVSDSQEITNGPIVDSVYLTLSLGQDLRPTVRMIKIASEDYEPSQIGEGSTGASSFQTRFNIASG